MGIRDRIYTMEAPGVCKEAVVLKDGKFAYVGTKEEALERFDLSLIHSSRSCSCWKTSQSACC